MDPMKLLLLSFMHWWLQYRIQQSSLEIISLTLFMEKKVLRNVFIVLKNVLIVLMLSLIFQVICILYWLSASPKLCHLFLNFVVHLLSKISQLTAVTTAASSDVMRRQERANAFCEAIRALDATGLQFISFVFPGWEILIF